MQPPRRDTAATSKQQAASGRARRSARYLQTAERSSGGAAGRGAAGSKANRDASPSRVQVRHKPRCRCLACGTPGSTSIGLDVEAAPRGRTSGGCTTEGHGPLRSSASGHAGKVPERRGCTGVGAACSAAAAALRSMPEPTPPAQKHTAQLKTWQQAALDARRLTLRPGACASARAGPTPPPGRPLRACAAAAAWPILAGWLAGGMYEYASRGTRLPRGIARRRKMEV